MTPTMKDINKKFSVRYHLNLVRFALCLFFRPAAVVDAFCVFFFFFFFQKKKVLVDEEDRRYFKQQEITLWRKPDAKMIEAAQARMRENDAAKTDAPAAE